MIAVNYDTAGENGASGRRLDKDAEIQSLCLLMYWTKANAFADMAADLVVKYVHAGLGSVHKAHTLRLINKEENKRKVRVASMVWNPFLFPWYCKSGGGIGVVVGGDGGGRWWCMVALVAVVEPTCPIL